MHDLSIVMGGTFLLLCAIGVIIHRKFLFECFSELFFSPTEPFKTLRLLFIIMFLAVVISILGMGIMICVINFLLWAHQQ